MLKSIYPCLFIFIALFHFSSYGQLEKKTIQALKIDKAPKIDGVLDEAIWKDVPVAADFLQLRPYNGKPCKQRTEVKFLYDNEALYVGAMLYDSAPDSIVVHHSKRDQFDVFDYFGVYIDPYNDAANAYGFFVSSSGTQMDIKATHGEWDNEDGSWDAVWQSAVNITKNGWVVEYKIPYSALRFPNKPVQTWGLNMFRNIQRYLSNNSWCFIDAKESGFLRKQGEMTGIKNIKPPIRLSLMPYFSSYFENNSGTHTWGRSLKGGMDVKYGLSESFTLDMMLIPDFGQVQSDDVRLNLSPFELYYDEKRPFFMEGTELFQRGNIFYSRRIGGEPVSSKSIYDKLSDNEEFTKIPAQTQLVNATKITGKTKKNLSVGFLNAMTINSYAEAKDTITGNKRKILAQPFTNYNVIALDQTLKNNSFISLVNTNYNRFADKYSANVTATQFKVSNKKNSYAWSGNVAVSTIHNDTSKRNTGFMYNTSFGKTKGKFQYSYTNKIENKDYNPNDMGFQTMTNRMQNVVSLEYNLPDPFGRFLRMYNYAEYVHTMLLTPFKFVQSKIYLSSFAAFKNNMRVNINSTFDLTEKQDFYEPRVDGRVFVRPANRNIGLFFGTDYNKDFSTGVSLSYSWTNLNSRHNHFNVPSDVKGGENSSEQYGYYIGIYPKLRLSSRFYIEYELERSISKNEFGWVAFNNENEEDIVFGKRNVKDVTNTIVLNYTMKHKMNINMRVRHNWGLVDYKHFYQLNNSGYFENSSYNENSDIRFSFFNIDFVYSWNFAPGSELAFVWKNSIILSGDEVRRNYFSNVKDLAHSDQLNSISFKILYYIDAGKYL